MQNKLFYKIFFNYIFILFFLSVIFILIVFNFTKKLYFMNIEDILRDDSYLINENIKQFMQNQQYKEIDKYIKKLRSDLNIRITIIKNDGTVIADSDQDPLDMANHKEQPEIQMAFKRETGHSVRYSLTTRQEMFYLARKFDLGNNNYYFIRTNFYLKRINAGFIDLRNKILLAVFFIFLIAAVFIYFYSKNFYKPIYDLKHAAMKIASGDFEHRIHFYKNNEFKDLADNFNLMTDEIKKIFIQLNEKQEQLKTIICSIDEGILVIDETGKIIFVNKKFNDIVNNICIESKYYWEFLLPPELIKIIETIKKNKNDILQNIEIKSKNFLCQVNFIKSYNEIIVILYDVSKIKELEKLKKDLVANVSHEIKTPLTAIKGFVETAIEETKDKKMLHYLEIINSNTQRLINILEDLLILSNLEQENRKLQIEDIDLKEILFNIEKLFVKRLKAKNLRFLLSVYQEKIKGDKFIIEQMLINLIDNAIKYTDKGEIRIIVYRRDDDNIIIEISDTGIGIPEEHIPRIFDRFYVVDNSRSKETGGTGLGLSIVKHCVNLHKGEIIVDSKPGHGTKFLIILPNKKV